MVAGLSGTVLERDGSSYRVATVAGIVRAVLRGKAKRGMPHVVVGDRVQLDAGAGREENEILGIIGVDQRRSLLARRNPEGRGTRPVAANVDQVFVVTATRDPAPIPQLLDRLLVVAEANSIPASVILNKVDLDPGPMIVERFLGAGYEVLPTSVLTGQGLPLLLERLQNRVSVVTGASGTGKSSLLNALQPGLALRTGTISRKVRRGTNTTVSAVMIPLEGGGFIVDTPGFSEVGLWGLEPAELEGFFPEFRPWLGHCRYGDCRHVREPGCAITAAIEEGRINPDRLASYRVLLAELSALPRAWE